MAQRLTNSDLRFLYQEAPEQEFLGVVSAIVEDAFRSRHSLLATVAAFVAALLDTNASLKEADARRLDELLLATQHAMGRIDAALAGFTVEDGPDTEDDRDTADHASAIRGATALIQHYCSAALTDPDLNRPGAWPPEGSDQAAEAYRTFAEAWDAMAGVLHGSKSLHDAHTEVDHTRLRRRRALLDNLIREYEVDASNGHLESVHTSLRRRIASNAPQRVAKPSSPRVRALPSLASEVPRALSRPAPWKAVDRSASDTTPQPSLQEDSSEDDADPGDVPSDDRGVPDAAGPGPRRRRLMRRPERRRGRAPDLPTQSHSDDWTAPSCEEPPVGALDGPATTTLNVTGPGRATPFDHARSHGSRHDDSAKSSDAVDCSVFAPPTIGQGSRILVQAFLHTPDEVDEVAKRAMTFDEAAEARGFAVLGIDLHAGQDLTLHLTVPGLRLPEPFRVVRWRGRSTSVGFSVNATSTTKLGTRIGQLTVSAEGIPIGHVAFALEVVPAGGSRPRAVSTGIGAARFTSAFASYASADRSEVVKRLQMLKPLGIKIFQDVISLDPGARWEQELYRYIDEADLFLLFWSSAASSSKWVRKEVSYALTRSAEGESPSPVILPIPIEGPPPVAPPRELSHLHFDDFLLYLAPSRARPGGGQPTGSGSGPGIPEF